MSTALEARGLSVKIGSTYILADISLSVARGEWVGVIGPNGAGKTTILRAFAGMLAFTGEVLVSGRALNFTTRRQLSRQIAIVPQHPQTPSSLTVAEYVLLGRTPYIGYFATETRSDRLAAERVMARLGLRRFANRTLGSLSGGELQRVVLARAFAQEAPILLLDEPTSALDLGRQQQALELIDDLRKESELTVLSAMHDLSLASQYAHRLVLINRGRLVTQGDPIAVLSEEAISTHYEARVRVIHEERGVFVLPRREEGPWLH